MMPASPKPHYYLLDIARGLGAFAIIFWHWKHFFFAPGTDIEMIDITSQPFYHLFAPLYRYGWIAVHFFFCLSGFIFFLFYSHALESKRINGTTFFIQRFSRLYPLHAITLFAIIALQWLYFQTNNTYFVHQNNSTIDIIKHLFLASNWLPNSPFSLNSPAWSISIEVLLYASFFYLCRNRLASIENVFLLSCAGSVLSLFYNQIGTGVSLFYMGGLVYFAIQHRSYLAHYCKAQRIKWGTLAVFGYGAFLFLPMILKMTSPHLPFLNGLVTAEILSIPGTLAWFLTYLIFPLVLLGLAWAEPYAARWARPWRWLGDISYSVYLIHFPLQLAMVIFAQQFGFSINPRSPLLFIIYFAILMLLATISHYWFERPMQILIRNAFKKAS